MKPKVPVTKLAVPRPVLQSIRKSVVVPLSQLTEPSGWAYVIGSREKTHSTPKGFLSRGKPNSSRNFFRT